MAQLLTNLHKSLLSDVNKQGLITGIKNKIQEIGSQLPGIMGNIDVSGHYIGIKAKLKKSFLKRLKHKGKKFRLALESLGWGTLSDMLDSAFCGEKLNLWV